MNSIGETSLGKWTEAAEPAVRQLAGSALLSEAEWIRVSAYFRLSGREAQIARRVFDDETEATIAANLGISPHTVHTHVERLYRKLAVATRVKLVLRILGQHLAALRKSFDCPGGDCLKPVSLGVGDLRIATPANAGRSAVPVG